MPGMVFSIVVFLVMWHHCDMPRVTFEEAATFRQMYDAGSSITDIARQHNRAAETVWRWLKKSGGTRSCGEAVSLKMARGEMPKPPIHRVWVFDEDVFCRGVTPEIAWLFGLIFADGSVRPEGRVQIACGQDRDLAEKAAAIIGYDGPLNFDHNCWFVEVSSVKTVASLRPFGIYPNKTYTMRFPSMPGNLVSHFVRGAWDGDGTVSESVRPYIKYTSSSKRFVEPLRDLLYLAVGVWAKVQEPPGVDARGIQDNSMTIAYGAGSAIRILDWMHRDSEPHMRSDRKFDIFCGYGRV